MRILPPDPGLLIVSCDGAAGGTPGPAGIRRPDHRRDREGPCRDRGVDRRDHEQRRGVHGGARGAPQGGGYRRTPRPPAVRQQAVDRATRGTLQGEGVASAAAARGSRGAHLGLRARAPPDTSPGSRSREADRLANLGVDLRGSGLAEPLTIPSGWIRPCKGTSNAVGPPGPRNVIRTVSRRHWPVRETSRSPRPHASDGRSGARTRPLPP